MKFNLSGIGQKLDGLFRRDNGYDLRAYESDIRKEIDLTIQGIRNSANSDYLNKVKNDLGRGGKIERKIYKIGEQSVSEILRSRYLLKPLDKLLLRLKYGKKTPEQLQTMFLNQDRFYDKQALLLTRVGMRKIENELKKKGKEFEIEL